jgi:hypothetical protein
MFLCSKMKKPKKNAPCLWGTPGANGRVVDFDHLSRRKRTRANILGIRNGSLHWRCLYLIECMQMEISFHVQIPFRSTSTSTTSTTSGTCVCSAVANWLWPVSDFVVLDDDDEE